MDIDISFSGLVMPDCQGTNIKKNGEKINKKQNYVYIQSRDTAKVDFPTLFVISEFLQNHPLFLQPLISPVCI